MIFGIHIFSKKMSDFRLSGVLLAVPIHADLRGARWDQLERRHLEQRDRRQADGRRHHRHRRRTQMRRGGQAGNNGNFEIRIDSFQ